MPTTNIRPDLESPEQVVADCLAMAELGGITGETALDVVAAAASNGLAAEVRADDRPDYVAHYMHQLAEVGRRRDALRQPVLYPYTVEWVGLLADGTDDPDRRGETSLHAEDADDAIARVRAYGDRRPTSAVELS